MTHDQQTVLSDQEIDDFLSRRETGVMSLASDDKPYAIPISFGYDSAADQFYIRLVSSDGTEKSEFVGTDVPARLVAYEEDGDSYRSVIAKGTLKRIDRDELDVEHVEQYGDAKRPLFEFWGAGKPELDIELYRLTAEELTGRVVEIDDSL